jgi:hypothetical protein
MQLFILFIGVMVFVVSLFRPPPMIFQPPEAARAAKTANWQAAETNYQHAFEQRRAAAFALVAHSGKSTEQRQSELHEFARVEKNFALTRQQALGLVAKLHGGAAYDDTNYIFLSFVKTYLPLGVVGLVIGVIFSASMGSTSGEINSLATVSVVDIYRRFLVRDRPDRHYLMASRAFTLFWGAYAVTFASIGARGFGALIERVNIVGSLFYGGLLGVFVLAFFCKRVGGTAAFIGVLAGEAVIFSVAAFTRVSFLWYNVVGCAVVVATAYLVSAVLPSQAPTQRA